MTREEAGRLIAQARETGSARGPSVVEGVRVDGNRMARPGVGPVEREVVISEVSARAGKATSSDLDTSGVSRSGELGDVVI